MSKREELTRTQGWRPASEPRDVSAIARSLVCVFPTDYVTFAETSDGYEGFFGQSYLVLHNPRSLEECQAQWHMRERFQGFVLLGTNGAGEMICLDARVSPARFALVPAIGSGCDAIDLGGSFEEFLERSFRGQWFR